MQQTTQPPPNYQPPPNGQQPQLQMQPMQNGMVNPQMMQAACVHSYKTEYSTCGLVWLVCCFPCGIICFLDSRRYICLNCGMESKQSLGMW